MKPNISNLSELGKEDIGDLYFLSLGNREMRKNHIRLVEATARPGPQNPSVHDLELDFTSWYGGVQSLAAGIEPGVALPGLKECVGYITQNFERAKTAIAA
jgi:hypothetical protein